MLSVPSLANTKGQNLFQVYEEAFKSNVKPNRLKSNGSKNTLHHNTSGRINHTLVWLDLSCAGICFGEVKVHFQPQAFPWPYFASYFFTSPYFVCVCLPSGWGEISSFWEAPHHRARGWWETQLHAMTVFLFLCASDIIYFQVALELLSLSLSPSSWGNLCSNFLPPVKSY